MRKETAHLNVAQGSFRVTVQRHGHGKSKPPHATPHANAKAPVKAAAKEVRGTDR